MNSTGYLLTPLPPCAILIDRHVHKNGGTTIRQLMVENAFRDGWAYWGYGLDSMQAVAKAIAAAISPAALPGGSCARWHRWTRRAPLRIAAELHYGNTLPGRGAGPHMVHCPHRGTLHSVRRW